MATKRNKSTPVTEAETIIANAKEQLSNFVGSIEEAFDDAFSEGQRDARGKGALLNTGYVAMRHAKVLRGKPSKKDEEFQANIYALRLKYVAGFNAIAMVESPCDVIPTEGEKAEKANKKQANKLGTFVKAGCLFETPEAATEYLDRVKAAVAATDYSKAKTRESTFERIKSALVGLDATATKLDDPALLERIKPEEAEEKEATDEAADAGAEKEAPVVTSGEALANITAALSQFVAKYTLTPANAAKLNAMVGEMAAMAKMLHAADVAEATTAEKMDEKQADAA